MRQYFRIKAYRENRKYKNIFLEHSGMPPQNFLDPTTDFIEYFPMTLINYRLDKSWYYILDDELKKMYHQKFRYERIFWIGFLLAFPLAFIASGATITDSGY